MARRLFGVNLPALTLTLTLVLVLVVGGGTLPAQDFEQPPGPRGPHGGPGMRPGGPQGGPDGPPGMHGQFQRDPEQMKKMKERRKKMSAARTTAEAHKNLADLYSQQNKTDAAVAELRKILEIANTLDLDEAEMDPKIRQALAQVYMEISELYMKADRNEDAKAVLNEGVQKLQKDDLEGASRMMLHLGNLHRKAGKTDEAEKAFKKVIELNAGKTK